jgi:hypothetical protein
MSIEDLPAEAYRQSYANRDGAEYWLEKVGTGRQLVVKAADAGAYQGFAGTTDGDALRADITPDNALELRNRLPWLKPQLFGLATSVGTGDRLGICTPGHVRALRAVGGGLKPVFAQQSIREMGRCHREPRNVLDDATWGAFQEGWTAGVGADADHLHTTEDIDRCAQAGFVFYTLDPNEYVDPEAESADEATIRSKAAALDWASLDSSQEKFLSTYVGHRIDLAHEAVTLDEESVLRAMAKYGPSLANAMDLYRHLLSLGIPHEVEFAVDETDYPTKPAEHVVVVSELMRLGMDFVSFAPRFVGGFEKGIEYIGDLAELKRDFEVHAEIAKALGPYKLSLHSGSDKYSTYPLFAEATGGLAHLKTAGTSWAEALRVIARHDGDLMREIVQLSLESFEQNRKSYHLSCDPAKVPTHPTDAELATLLDVIDSRQVLHVAYGAILDAFKPRMYEVWQAHDEELYGIIEEHFIKHLAPFVR